MKVVEEVVVDLEVVNLEVGVQKVLVEEVTVVADLEMEETAVEVLESQLQ